MTTSGEESNLRMRLLMIVTATLSGLARAWGLLVLGLGVAAGFIPGSGFPFATALALLLAGGLLVATRHASRAGVTERYWSRAGLVVLSGAILAGFAWVWHFDSVQGSDFGVYLRCGMALQDSLSAWINACQSHYLRPNGIYWSRAFLYSAPLGLVGAQYAALKYVNALWHGITLVVWFVGLRRVYGARVATVALGLLALSPEWWFTLTLATTDNAVLLCLVAFVVLVPQLGRTAGAGYCLLGLAGALFAAQQLRTIGPLLVLALLGWTCWWYSTSHRLRLLGQVAVVLGLYTVSTMWFASLLPPATSDPLQLLKALSALDLSSVQDFTSNYPWFEHFWPAIPAAWRRDVGLHVLWSEMLQSFAKYPVYLFRKAALLLTGGGYYFFATADLGLNPDTVYTVGTSTVPTVPGLAVWLATSLRIQLVVASWAVLWHRLDRFQSAALMLFGSCTLVILGLGEVQPRYSVLLAPALALLAATALLPRDALLTTAPCRGRTAVGHPAATTALGLGLLGLLYMVGCLLPQTWQEHLSQALPQARQEPAHNRAGPPCNTVPVRVETSYKRLRLLPPPEAPCLSVALPIRSETRAVAFFVSGTRFPFPFEPRVSSAYRYAVYAADHLLLDAALGMESVRWHRVELAPASSPRILSFQVWRTDAASALEPLDVWWLQEFQR